MSELSVTTAEAISRQYLANPPAGRYSALADADIIETVLSAVRKGLNQTAACEAAGIDPATFRRWLRRADEEPESAYARFAQELKQVRRLGQLAHLDNIAEHSKTWWQASAWTLERTDPEQFALRKDDAAVPRVVVNIGASNSDVKVQVIAGECQDPGTTLIP